MTINNAIEYFVRGLSPFSAEYRDKLNDVAEAAYRFQTIEAAVQERLIMDINPDGGGVGLTQVDALIYGYSGGSNRWEYAWVESTLNAGSYSVKENGRSSEVGGDIYGDPAFNTVEGNNASNEIDSGGFNTANPSLGPGFFLQPIRGGSWTGTTETPGDPGTSGTIPPSQGVPITLTRRNGRWEFALTNWADGTCPPEEPEPANAPQVLVPEQFTAPVAGDLEAGEIVRFGTSLWISYDGASVTQIG